jgi:hypothetical protein
MFVDISSTIKMASVVETVTTYIPEDVIGLFKRVDAYEIDPFIDHEMAAKVLVSVYHDAMNIDDPSGLGILSHIAMKLMTLPQYTLRARRVYENIEMLIGMVMDGYLTLIQTIMLSFTLEELKSYGY